MAYIAIDFDGTLFEHKYPLIGNEIKYAFDVLKTLRKKGHKLILLTMRSDKELYEAVEACKEKGISFWAVNDNPDQLSWTSSRKVYAQYYIDDAALGCPLIDNGIDRPYVDWRGIHELLKENNLL